MTMLRSLPRRGLVAQSLASVWLWFPFALAFCMLVLFELDTTLWDRNRTAAGAWPYIVCAVVVLLLWYFVIARIPDRVRSADVRGQVGADSLVAGVRLNRQALEWLNEVRRESRDQPPSNWGSVLSATATDLQFWMGPARDSTPVGIIPWSSIESIASSPTSRTLIRVSMVGASAIELRAVDQRRFAPIIARARARAELVDKLELLRRDSAKARA